jgi:hypothetical protein
MYNPYFDLDLKTGQQGEALVEAGLTGKVEVKLDRRAQDTGNLYIEVWQFSKPDRSDKRPSGISVTKAEWWITTAPNLQGFIAIKVHTLKDLIKANAYTQTAQPITNEHTNGSIGYLVPVSDIIKAIGL